MWQNSMDAGNKMKKIRVSYQNLCIRMRRKKYMIYNAGKNLDGTIILRDSLTISN